MVSNILLTSTVLLPLLVLPLGESWGLESKQFLLLTVGLVGLGLRGIKLITQAGKIKIHHCSSLTIGLILWAGVILLSGLISNGYPLAQFLGWGGLYLSLIAIVAWGPELSHTHFSRHFLTSLGIGGGLLGLVSLLQLVGWGPSWLYNALFQTNFEHNLSFNLVESPLVAAQLLLVALVGYSALLAAGRLATTHLTPARLDTDRLDTDRQKQTKITLLTWLVTAALLIGLAVNLYSIRPGSSLAPVLPPLAASWSIALDSIRSLKTALLGVGPNNYQAAYVQLKPAWINQTQWWNIHFTRGFNLPLTLVTSTGLLGLLGWGWLVGIILARFKRQTQLRRLPLSWMLLTLLMLQLILPPTASTLTLFGLTLAAWLALPSQEWSQERSDNIPLVRPLVKPLLAKLPRLFSHRHQQDSSYHRQWRQRSTQLLGLTLLVLSTLGLYAWGRVTLAKYKVFAATQAGEKNQVVTMYQLQQKAVQLNPYSADSHRRYAMINLSLATALANKTELGEAETHQILQLVQQAIREGQTASQLQPTDVNNWRVLAQIYTNLTGVATGADDWAVKAYGQAIQASPTDPELRVALGQIFYNLGQYDQAGELFSQAIQLKADYPHAHYHLALTLQAQNRLTEAVTAYENVLKLIEPGTADYQQAEAELTTLRKNLNQETTNSTQ